MKYFQSQNYFILYLKEYLEHISAKTSPLYQLPLENVVREKERLSEDSNYGCGIAVRVELNLFPNFCSYKKM